MLIFFPCLFPLDFQLSGKSPQESADAAEQGTCSINADSCSFFETSIDNSFVLFFHPIKTLPLSLVKALLIRRCKLGFEPVYVIEKASNNFTCSTF